MPSRDAFEYESLQDIESIVGYFGALADGLKRGHLSLSSNGKLLALRPSGLLRLSVEAKRGKTRSRLIVKVSWREDAPDEPKVAEPLKIRPGPA